jgi:hypothetical protein
MAGQLREKPMLSVRARARPFQILQQFPGLQWPILKRWIECGTVRRCRTNAKSIRRSDVGAAIAVALTAAGYANGESFEEIISARLAASGSSDRRTAIADAIAQAAVLPDEYDADGRHWISLKLLGERHGHCAQTAWLWEKWGHPAFGLAPGNTLEVRRRKSFQGKGAAARRPHNYVREDQIAAIKTCTNIDPTPAGMVDRARMLELGVSKHALYHFSKQIQAMPPKVDRPTRPGKRGRARRGRPHPLLGRLIDGAVYDAVIKGDRREITRWSEADGKRIGQEQVRGAAPDWEPPEPAIWIHRKKVTMKVYGFTAAYAKKHGAEAIVVAAPKARRPSSIGPKIGRIVWREYLRKSDLIRLSRKVEPRGERAHVDTDKSKWMPHYESRIKVRDFLVGRDLAEVARRTGCKLRTLQDAAADSPESNGRRGMHLLLLLPKELGVELRRKKIPAKEIGASSKRHGHDIWVYRDDDLHVMGRKLKGEPEPAAAPAAAPASPAPMAAPAVKKVRKRRVSKKQRKHLELLHKWETDSEIRRHYHFKGGVRGFSKDKTGDPEALKRLQDAVRQREYRKRQK